MARRFFVFGCAENISEAFRLFVDHLSYTDAIPFRDSIVIQYFHWAIECLFTLCISV